MRYIVFIILVAIGYGSCKNPDQKYDNGHFKTNQTIKVCKIYSSDFAILNPNEKGQLIQEFRFNKEGYVNELIRYGMDGEIIGRFEISGKNTPFPMPEKPVYVDTVLTVVNIDSVGVINNKEVKTYNKNGLLIEVVFYHENDKLIKKNTYEYNSNGFIISDTYWDTDLNKPNQIIRYEYEFFIN